MKTYNQLMRAYEKAFDAYAISRSGTLKNERLGKTLDKAREALEQFRAVQSANVKICKAS